MSAQSSSSRSRHEAKERSDHVTDIPSEDPKVSWDEDLDAYERFSQYVCNARDVIKFKMIRKETDIDDPSLEFSPVFVHQLFGEREQILGYKGLKIQLCFTEYSMHMLVRISYDGVIHPSKQLPVDNIERILRYRYTPRAKFFDESRGERRAFVRALKTQTFELIGEELSPPYHRNIGNPSPTTNNNSSSSSNAHHSYAHHRRFKPGDAPRRHRSLLSRPSDASLTYHQRLNLFSDPKFKLIHARLEFFILFFIDASSYIDSNDEIWEVVMMFEERENAKGGFDDLAVVGYCTLYKFMHFPNQRRLRLSQIFLLPPYQHAGHGGKLVQNLYGYAKAEGLTEVNIEDPSKEMQFLRDLTDVRRMHNGGYFRARERPNSAMPWYLKLDAVDTEYMKAVQTALCITEKQVAKCRQIFQLSYLNHLDRNDADFTRWRLSVKRRIYELFAKDLGPPPDKNDADACADFKARLEHIYADFEATYLALLAKLDAGGRARETANATGTVMLPLDQNIMRGGRARGGRGDSSSPRSSGSGPMESMRSSSGANGGVAAVSRSDRAKSRSRSRSASTGSMVDDLSLSVRVVQALHDMRTFDGADHSPEKPKDFAPFASREDGDADGPPKKKQKSEYR